MIRNLFSNDLEAKSFGQKAHNLHRLNKFGFNVPAGFALSAGAALENLTDQELQEVVTTLGGFPIAARSSGVMEDLNDSSFAGLYESILHIESIGQLREALARIAVSDQGERATSYSKLRGFAPGNGIAVIIQKQVKSSFAGVIFTLNPLNGKEDELLIEFVDGYGDKLVEGKVQPTTIIVDRESLHIKEAKNEGVHLSLEQIKKLANIAIQIQAKFQAPQDIEWAFDEKGELHVLQARPITKFNPRSDVDQFSNADLKDGGVSARVTSPMMASLYTSTFSPSMDRYLKDIRLLSTKSTGITWMRAFYGRLYWNASETKICLEKIPGFDEKKFDDDLGIQIKYQGEPRRTPNSIKYILPAIPVALALNSEFKRHLKTAPRKIEDFFEQEKIWLAKAAQLSKKKDSEFFQELNEVLFDFYHSTECFYFRTIFNCSNAQTTFHDSLKKINSLISEPVELTELISGVNNISHMDYQTDLISLASAYTKFGKSSDEFKSALNEFQVRNYHHSEAELDLMVPRFGEDLSFVMKMVETYSKNNTEISDPDFAVAKQELRYHQTLEKITRQLKGFKHLMTVMSFKANLERVRAFLVLRERVRDLSSRSYAIVRMYLLEAGRRLHANNFLQNESDVFMLTLAEIKNRNPQDTKKIPARKLFMEGYREFRPPNELGRGLVNKSKKDFQANTTGTGWIGLGASPGSVTAPVRIIRDLSEVGSIQPGEILVTRFTDPGWTPVLGMVKGVITEVGGVLTHAAVISREFGIPAVLNVEGITKELRTGQIVHLDGSLGQIKLVDEVYSTPQPQTLAHQPSLQ